MCVIVVVGVVVVLWLLLLLLLWIILGIVIGPHDARLFLRVIANLFSRFPRLFTCIFDLDDKRLCSLCKVCDW